MSAYQKEKLYDLVLTWLLNYRMSSARALKIAFEIMKG